MDHNHNQWTINLSSLCKAAARKDRKTVKSYLMDDNENDVKDNIDYNNDGNDNNDDDENNAEKDEKELAFGTRSTISMTKKSRWKNMQTESKGIHAYMDSDAKLDSNLIQPSVPASSLLDLLLCQSMQDDNGHFYHQHDCKDDTNKQQKQQQPVQNKYLKHFSNVCIHILPPSFSEKEDNDSSNSNKTVVEKQQKFQLSMSFRSLLLLPSHHATPWETIQEIIKLVIQQHEKNDICMKQPHLHRKDGGKEHEGQSLFGYYFFHDATFAMGILAEIQEYLDRFCNELQFLQSQSASLLSQTTINYQKSSRIEAIMIAFRNVFSTLVKPIFQNSDTLDLRRCGVSHLSYSSYEHGCSDDYDDQNCCPHYHHYMLLFEIIQPFIEASKSFDTFYQHKDNDDNSVHRQNYYYRQHLTMEIQMVDLLFPSPSCMNNHDTNNHYNNGSIGNINSSNRSDNTFGKGITIRSELILPLLTLSVHTMSQHMNDGHWNNLCRMVYHISHSRNKNQPSLRAVDNDDDEDDHLKVPQSDFPDICQLIITIIVSKKMDAETAMTGIDNDYYCEIAPSWTHVLVEIYYTSRIYDDILGMIESKIEESIINLPPHCCNILVEEIVKVWKHYNNIYDSDADTEKKISQRKAACLNLLFIILHGQQRSDVQTISHLLSESLDIDKEEPYMSDTLDALLSLTSLPLHIVHSCDQIHEQREVYESFFKNAYYDINARIEMLGRNKSPPHEYIHYNFHNLVQLINLCFSFYQTHDGKKTCDKTNIKINVPNQCIKRFIDVAQSILEVNGNQVVNCWNKTLFSIAIFVLLFVQVASSRSVLIQHFVKVVSTHERESKNIQQSIDPRLVNCWTISCIINTYVKKSTENVTQSIFQTDNQSIIDFFQPLCNLLLFENDNEMLGLSVMSALISSLSIIPYAREALIKMINQNLQMKGPNERKKSNPFNNQENINIAIEGLLILIQEKPSLNKSDCRYMIDDVGLKALIHVSNLIVLNRPDFAITSHCRSFLLVRLVELVQNHAISDWVAERILASTLTALLQHFRSTLSHDFIFVPLCERKDPTEIHRDVNALTMITMLLIQYKPHRSPTSTCSSFSCEEVDILLSPLKRLPREVSFENGNRINLRSIALSCFGAMIMYVTQTSIHKNEFWKTLNDVDTCSNIYQKKILQVEIKIIEETLKCRSGLTSQMRHNFPSPEDLIMSEEELLSPKTLLLYPSTHDSLIKLLMSACETFLPTDRQHFQHVQTRERIVSLLTTCGLLQSAKHAFLIASKSKETITACNGNDATNIANFFVNIAAAFNYTLQETKREVKDLDLIKSLMNALEKFCDATKSIYEQDSECDESTFVGHIESIRAMWSYYNSSCNEIRCCDLIDFFESDNNLDQRISNCVPLHGPFPNTDATYEFIRKYRFSFMSCFGIMFQSHLKRNVWKNNKDSYFLFCVDLACTLPQDLCSGLKGMSGGITQSLYRCYIEIIEAAVQAALHIPNKSVLQSCSDFDEDLFCDLKISCDSASTALWNVICVTDIKSPPVFKSTFQICTMHLPQLYRRINRIALLNFPSVAVSLNCGPDSDALVELKASTIMEECICQLKDLAEGGTKKRKHIHQNKSGREGLRYILASNKKLLEWTFENSITVIEKLWLETWQLLNNQKPSETCTESFIPIISNAFNILPAIETYSAKHLSIMKQSLSAMASFLSAVHQLDTQASDIEELAFTTRRRLSSCMERIFLTLKLSIRFISKIMNEIENGIKVESNPFSQVSIAESVLCIIAWLTTPDFTLTAKKYHASLTASKTKRRLQRKHKTDDLSHVRMTKVIHKIEESEKVLSQLFHFLRKSRHVGHDLDCFTQKLSKNLTMTQIIGQYEKLILSHGCESEISSSDRFRKVDSRTLKKRLREACKEKKRSQNAVVNEWMYLDSELNEEGKSDDNFEDLEDFLLPG